jgi:hypothetical protein
VGDSGDDHDALRVVDGVNDPVAADSDAVAVTAGELGDSRRARIGRESVDRVADRLRSGPWSRR